MCETHGRPGVHYCRRCGEMVCDLEDCDCDCFRCRCPCHGDERVHHD